MENTIGKPLGMPAARRFSLRASRNRPVFVVSQSSLGNVYHEVNLRDAGIDWDTYGVFEDTRVFAFNETEMGELLTRTGLVMIQRFGSTRANVEWVVLAKKPDLPADVSKSSINGAFLHHLFEQPRDAFEGECWITFSYLVSRILGPVVKRKITFSVPHGYHHEYNSRGGFQVYVWSTPSADTSRDTVPPTHIMGYEVDRRDECFLPLPVRKNAGVLIKDGGYAVAELLENALYIHHDLVHRGSENAFRMMARILEEAAKILQNPTTLANKIAKARAPYIEKQKNAFSDLVKRAIPERTLRHKSMLENARKEATERRKEYFDAERKVFGLTQAVIDPVAVESKFRAEFAKLQEGRVEFVEKVELEARKGTPLIHVYTSAITAVNPRTGDTHLMGHYNMVVDLDIDREADNEDLMIRMFNLDRVTEDTKCHHPHVDEEGIPCLGNLCEQLPEYIAHFELEAAVTLAIAFLQTMTPGDWFVGPEDFPIVKAPKGARNRR